MEIQSVIIVQIHFSARVNAYSSKSGPECWFIILHELMDLRNQTSYKNKYSNH